MGGNTSIEEDIKQTDLTGKYCIVTGGNQGIGYSTALALARMNAKVFIASDDEQGSEKAIKLMKSMDPSISVTFMKLDLSSLNSVRQFVKKWKASGNPIHILVNNAGCYSAIRKTTPDGFEYTLAVNYLGHYLLTTMLMGVLKSSAPSRVVIVTSMAYVGGIIHWDDINMEKNWSGLSSYANAKMAELLFAMELGRRLIGTGVTVYAVTPGLVDTESVGCKARHCLIIVEMGPLVTLVGSGRIPTKEH